MKKKQKQKIHHPLTISKHGEEELGLLKLGQNTEHVELELHGAYPVVHYGIVLDALARVRRSSRRRRFIVVDVVVIVVINVGR